MNSIGHGILQDHSGCLVQCSEQFTALQKRRAAQNGDVHLTVISRQLGQQVGFKRGSQQPTGHTWKRWVKSVMVLRPEAELLSSPLSFVYTSYHFILCFCQYASNHQQLQFQSKPLHWRFASGSHRQLQFFTSTPNLIVLRKMILVQMRKAVVNNTVSKLTPTPLIC